MSNQKESTLEMTKMLLVLSLLSTSLMAQVATSTNPSIGETSTAISQNKRQPQPNEHFLNLPGTSTIDAPPEGFDPVNVSDAERAYHGFPPAPDRNAEPEKFAHWAQAMRASKTRIVPILQQTNRVHGPSQKIQATDVGKDLAGPGGAVTNSSLISPNWSGYLTPSGTSTFFFIVGDMIVPHAQQPLGTCGGVTGGSEWVGIDGFQNSGDVLQAGIEFDTFCASNVTNAAYNIWYEWFPDFQVSIPNFPVNPGDDVFVEVWHTSPTQGSAFFVNQNTKQSAQFGFTAPSGTKLVGTEAEWVVERTTLNGSLPTLTNFTSIPFFNAFAVTESGIIDTVGAEPIEMLDKSKNTVLAFPVLTGKESFVAQTPGH